MSRAVGVVLLAAAWLWALLDLLWWAPSIALMAARLAGVWVRSWATLACIDVLVVAGQHEAARRLCERSLARCRRRVRELGR